MLGIAAVQMVFSGVQMVHKIATTERCPNALVECQSGARCGTRARHLCVLSLVLYNAPVDVVCAVDEEHAGVGPGILVIKDFLVDCPLRVSDGIVRRDRVDTLCNTRGNSSLWVKHSRPLAPFCCVHNMAVLCV